MLIFVNIVDTIINIIITLIAFYYFIISLEDADKKEYSSAIYNLLISMFLFNTHITVVSNIYSICALLF